MATAGGRSFLAEETLPSPHPNLLWVAVPDVVGDADATLERFREWHMWLCHLGRLAFVLQDGAERPGRVPWQAPGLCAVFVGGSTRWKLGPDAAHLVREARRRGLLAHMGGSRAPAESATRNPSAARASIARGSLCGEACRSR